MHPLPQRRRPLPEPHRDLEIAARALVADPHRALAAGAGARRRAWAILLSARGSHAVQIVLIRDARARGIAE